MIEPEYACPLIDSAISEMENVRKRCEELRRWGQHYVDKAAELQDELDEAKEIISQLKDEVSDLKYELSRAEKKLAEY